MISLDEMKLETNWFLKKIIAYNAQPNICIDEHMVKLFYDATQKIADCVDQSQVVKDANHKRNIDILFDIDESCYRYHRSIMCTICNVNIEITKSEYLAHVNGDMHKRKLTAMANGSQNSHGQRNLTGPIMDVVDSAVSLMMQSNGNANHAANNNITTEEYFHVPSPMPHNMRCSTPLTRSSVQLNTNNVRELGQSMNNLNVRGIDNASARQMVSRAASAIENPPELKARQFDFIRNAIKTLLPKAKVYIYGSHNYGLADDRSDLNAYIDLEGGHAYNLQRTKAIMVERQMQIVRKLKRDTVQWKNVVSDQRLVLYPLVRATSVPLSVNCTFSFGTGLFVEANYLIKDYIDALPMAHSMIAFLKQWQYHILQNETNTFEFSTYQIAILVIWYFQLWKYLPSVKSMQSSTNRVYCGDAQIDYRKPIKILKPTNKQLNNYLLDFFDFFGNQYNPKKDIISAYYGKLLKRNYTSDNDIDNWELCKYIRNANQSLWMEPHAHMLTHDVYLQSASPNVTANITLTALSAFRTHCKFTADFLLKSTSN